MRRLASVVVLALALAGCNSTEGLTGPELYAQVCAGCHGGDGSGGAGPAIWAGTPAVGLNDDQIAGVIRVGPGAMPGFPRLTDEQVDSLVLFVRALQGP